MALKGKRFFKASRTSYVQANLHMLLSKFFDRLPVEGLYWNQGKVRTMRNKKTNFHDLSRKQLSKDSFRAFIDEITSQSDRACALVAAASLDDVLKNILVAQFFHLDDVEIEAMFDANNAMLSSFSNKIALAHALCCITDENKSDLSIIRRIRNVFAHTAINVDFDTDIINNECLKLKAFENIFDGPKENCTPRQLFMGASLYLYLHLMKKLLHEHEALNRATRDVLRELGIAIPTKPPRHP
jgi:hypothetical protein